MNKFLRILFFLFIVKPILHIFIGVNIFGKENLPLSKPVIIVANHNSHLDAVALMSLFPLKQLHQVHPVAASDYFMKNRFLSWFSTTFLNILPIPRSKFTKENNPLLKMAEALSVGKSLILFPEGSRGEPEQMANFKSGIAHLIEKNPEIPIVPIFLKGMGKSLPKGEMVLVPFFCDIVIGQPQSFTGERAKVIEKIEKAVSELKNMLS